METDKLSSNEGLKVISEQEKHPMGTSLARKLEIPAFATLAMPGYAGTGILLFGGWMDETTRNISLGMIGWTLSGIASIYLAPKIFRKTRSFVLGIIEDIDKLAHH